MKLVVGLGNPGPRYANTRHNVGFRVVERFAADHGIALDREDFGGRFGRGVLRGAPHPAEVALLLPLTFMNLSGDSVAEAVASLPVEDPADLLVVFDDVDLPFGKLRMRKAGGAGGQRGLAHTIERLGTKAFPRLRFGVGRPQGGHDTADHVLQGFARDEERALPEHLARAADAVTVALAEGVDIAMNRFNPDPATPPDPDEGAPR